MKDQEIAAKVEEYIKEKHGDSMPSDFNYTTKLISSGIVDSISVLQLVDFLEQDFNIEFQPHEVDHDNLNTIDKIVEFVKSKS